MSILILCLVVVLGAIALLHGMWGIGWWVPLWDETKLVRAVVGAKGADRMPGPIPCGLVSAALLVVMISLLSGPSFAREFVISAAAIVLVARGLLAFVPFWRRMTPAEPFATLDRRFYGPLCLLLGCGLAIVALA